MTCEGGKGGAVVGVLHGGIRSPTSAFMAIKLYEAYGLKEALNSVAKRKRG